jgi:hypothetical protein
VPQNDRPVKCPYCEKSFKRSEEQFIYHKNRYWHQECFNTKNESENDRQKLINYIERLFHKKIDYKIRNQLTSYIEHKKYSYKDIYNALYYFFDIKGNSIAKANGGIGIVPYVIEEAKEYVEEKKNVAARVKSVSPIVETKKVIIRNPIIKDKYKDNRQIDILEI